PGGWGRDWYLLAADQIPHARRVAVDRHAGAIRPMTSERGLRIATGTTVGHYEIVGWLGAGGMGDVYRARDERLGRDVAIKMIAETFAGDATRVRRFEQEARAAGQLNHPNILAVYDVGLHAGA